MERKKVFEIMLFGMAVQALIAIFVGHFLNIRISYEEQTIYSLVLILVSWLLKAKKKQ